MKSFYKLAILTGAMLAAIPATASTTTFNFTNCDTNTGGTNSPCSSDLSAYSVTPSGQSGTPITATATAYFTTNTTTADFNTGEVGAYKGYGLGICENQSFGNCTDPYHQIDNGSNPNSGQDYEFMLIHFSSAVNLSQITLGNFGVPSGSADPFIATYWTSSVTSLSTPLTGVSINSLTGTDGFGAKTQTVCTTNCAVGDTGTNEALNADDVTYLLIGASINPANVGQDYFKIQDITDAPSSTPEPATFGLLGIALTGLGIYGRKRKSSRS